MQSDLAKPTLTREVSVRVEEQTDDINLKRKIATDGRTKRNQQMNEREVSGELIL